MFSSEPPTSGIKVSAVLAVMPEKIGEAGISLDELMQLFGTRSLGVVIHLFSLPLLIPVPIPGLSTLCSVPLLFASYQLLLNKNKMWLPKKLSQQIIPKDSCVKIVSKILPLLKYIECLSRPRLIWLFSFVANPFYERCTKSSVGSLVTWTSHNRRCSGYLWCFVSLFCRYILVSCFTRFP